MNHVIGYNTIREVPLDSMLMEILKFFFFLNFI